MFILKHDANVTVIFIVDIIRNLFWDYKNDFFLSFHYYIVEHVMNYARVELMIGEWAFHQKYLNFLWAYDLKLNDTF